MPPNTQEFASMELRVGMHEARLTNLERRCEAKEEKYDELVTKIIPPITQWQASAFGIAIGLTSAGGIIGALLTYIFEHKG